MAHGSYISSKKIIINSDEIAHFWDVFYIQLDSQALVIKLKNYVNKMVSL